MFFLFLIGIALTIAFSMSRQERMQQKVYIFEKIQTLFVRFGLFLLNQTSQLRYYLEKYYENDPMVKEYVDKISNTINYYQAFITGKKVEPDNDFWTCHLSIQEIVSSEDVNETPEYKLDENYQIVDFDKDFDDLIEFEQKIKESIITTYQYLSNIYDGNSLREHTIIGKTSSYYFVYYINQKTQKKNPLIIFEKSLIKFLSIQYIHSQCNPIPINIPESMITVGNELFSPSFVLRYLQYQDMPYHFDYEYKIQIIDDNINEVELNSSQYIILGKHRYEVKTISVEESEKNEE
jgi:hypothetical protein